jgi:hypothetical protein
MSSITNTSARRITFGKFMGLLILSLLLCSYAVYSSMHNSESFPQEEYQKLKQKEALWQEMALLSIQLRRYENAQRASATNINEFEASCQALSVSLHSKIAKIDSSKSTQSIKQILDMSDQYASFIRQSSSNLEQNVKAVEGQIAPLNQQILDMQMKNLDLQEEKQQLQIQMMALLQPSKASGSGSSGGKTAPTAKAKVTEPPPVNSVPANQQTQVTSSSKLNCDAIISEYQSTLTVYTDEIGVSCQNLRGVIYKLNSFFKRNKAEKEEMESEIRAIEEQLANLQQL